MRPFAGLWVYLLLASLEPGKFIGSHGGGVHEWVRIGTQTGGEMLTFTLTEGRDPAELSSDQRAIWTSWTKLLEHLDWDSPERGVGSWTAEIYEHAQPWVAGLRLVRTGGTRSDGRLPFPVHWAVLWDGRVYWVGVSTSVDRLMGCAVEFWPALEALREREGTKDEEATLVAEHCRDVTPALREGFLRRIEEAAFESETSALVVMLSRIYLGVAGASIHAETAAPNTVGPIPRRDSFLPTFERTPEGGVHATGWVRLEAPTRTTYGEYDLRVDGGGLTFEVHSLPGQGFAPH